MENWALFLILGGNYSSGGQGNRGSWSPTDSPAASRKQQDGDSDVDEGSDPRYEFHDDNGRDDSETNNSSRSSHREEKVVKQLKPIGRRIADEQQKTTTTSERPRADSAKSVHKPDLMADLGDAHQFGKAQPAGGDDWADFASARTDTNHDERSPDDFIEGLTKLTFSKSFKPPPSGTSTVAHSAAPA